MALKLSTRKRPSREDKPLYERNKITAKALDNSTVDVLIHLLNGKVLSSMDYPVAAGKEAVVFRATRPDGSFVAVKVFKYETTALRHMAQYIEGDPRFAHVRHATRSITLDWARKEFANLHSALEAGVACPTPILLRKNVIVMEFLGKAGVPYALLQDVVVADAGKMFSELIGGMKKLYSAGLVHADLSPYNIMVREDSDGNQSPVIIDWAQGVLLDHPRSREFLSHDVRTLCNYFSKLGVEADAQSIVADFLALPTKLHSRRSRGGRR